MKTTWSAFVSFLLLVLVLLFAGFGVFTSTTLPMRLGAGALGLCFLITFINGVWPDGEHANKVVKALNLCAGGLFAVAMLLVLQHYFNTMHLA